MRGAVAVHLCRGREWRGGERQVGLLVQTLAWRSTFLQHLVAGRGSALANTLGAAGPAVTPVPWTTAYDPRALLAILTRVRQLRALHRGEILLHAHDSHALAMGILVARLLHLPCVATRRSVTAPGLLWQLPDWVIAISGAVEDALRAAGVAPSRIVRIPSAVSLSALTRIRPHRFHTPRQAAVPVIVAAGAMTAEKGHGILIEALGLLRRRVPEAALALVGDGPARAELEALAHRRGLAGRIRFHGEKGDASNLIRAANVLAQPSLREALGTTVLEAMALGTPVVATRTGGLTELLADGAGLLVSPGDPWDLAEALERVLTDPLLRAAMVHQAHARVQEYDAPGVADRVAQVYRSALRMT
jgi:glycosyltransferase involved in cell wall biosynthesis